MSVIQAVKNCEHFPVVSYEYILGNLFQHYEAATTNCLALEAKMTRRTYNVNWAAALDLPEGISITKPDISNSKLTSVSPFSLHSILPIVTPSALHGAWPSAPPSVMSNFAFTNAPSLVVDKLTGTPTASPTTLAKM
eukprot:12985074-Ditylum_brightwellii.AAC.1